MVVRKQMNNILKNANDRRKRVNRRAIAHELSAEFHRHRGVQIGILATVISAIVGSTVFVTLITRIGLDGKGTISVPSKGWGWLAYVGFAFLSVLAPVLIGLQTFLNHPGEAEKHTISSAEYYHLLDRLDSLISLYPGEQLTGTQIEAAEKEMADISNEIEKTHKKSIQLTKRAIRDADTQIRLDDSSGDEA